jgi:large-conductance mechanosensitive channel
MNTFIVIISVVLFLILAVNIYVIIGCWDVLAWHRDLKHEEEKERERQRKEERDRNRLIDRAIDRIIRQHPDKREA